MQSYMHMHCQARQLDSYSSARHCSTARQLLDRPRQTSTDLDAPAHGVSLDRLDRLDRQGLDNRLDSASTEPRQLDSSTARAQVCAWTVDPRPVGTVARGPKSARARARVDRGLAGIAAGRAVNGTRWLPAAKPMLETRALVPSGSVGSRIYVRGIVRERL